MSQPSPLTPARQRAQVLADSGDLTGAIALLERAVELGKINLAEDDPDVLRTSYLLGQMLRRDDDPSGARRVLEDAYAAGMWRLGESDALMLEISHDIGVVAEELGNRHEARKAFGRVAELGPATLGAGHWAVARARAYLGQDQEAAVRAGDPSPAVPASGPPADEATTTLPIQPVVPDEEATGPIPALPTPGSQVQPPTPANQQHWPAPAGPQPPRAWHEQPPIWEATPAQAPAQEAQQPPWPAPAHPQAAQLPPWPGPPQPYGQERQPPQWAGTPHPYGQDTPQPPPKRTLGIFAAIAAVLAAVIAVSALVFVLANRSGDKPDSDVPTLGGNPPTDVALRDEGSRIRVTWADPANGKVSFLVAMAQPGQQLRPVSTLGPGTTSFEITGLNANLNYCFAVVAVYRNDKFATSQQACTNRSTSTK
ncbi:tetratricopeptide repeat protein [Actinoplanes subtropicus]|uniref:tetratricopeptide repeat protein n=1 Tax=Actinoplanes subtropicus TaxID=543632 RepID=UPI0014701638|nr:tetratricopeptide repeat protein [Actinoplanes subtropicus]